MKKGSAFRIVCLVVDLFLYFIVVVLFVNLDITFSPAYDYKRQFMLSMAGSLLMSLLLLSSRKTAVRIATFGFRMIFIAMIGVPLRDTLWIEICLMSALLWSVAHYLPIPGNIVACGICIGAGFLMQTPRSVFNEVAFLPPLRELVVYLGQTSLIAAAGIFLKYSMDRADGLMRNRTRLQCAIDRIAKTNINFQDFAISTQRESRDEERKRISREIHDQIGYSLTNILMMLKTTRILRRNDADLCTRLDATIQYAQQTLMEIRGVLHNIYSREMEESYGIKAIHEMVKNFGYVSDIAIKLEWGNLPWNSHPTVQKVIFRMIQESLINAFRHGQAETVKISFFVNSGVLQIRIQDDGKGSDMIEFKKGIGLSGMQRRIELLGGQMKSGGNREGFLIEALIPMLRETTK